MALARLAHALDTSIGHLPTPLANLAAGLIVAGFAYAYTYLATGAWLRPQPDTED